MAGWNIEGIYEAECTKEISVAVNGICYLVIFGTHINGGFCCIPGRGVGCELSSHDHFCDIYYNSERIGKALKDKTAGRCIAEAISTAALYDDERED